MSTLFFIPIEPLTERYSESWYRNMPKAFAEYFDEVRVIDGEPLLDSIVVGTFLDMNSTVHYKNTQMREIAKLFLKGAIKNGDVFFFADLEFWGAESLRLMAQLNKVNVKIYGFMHAASYTIEDAFAIAAPYQKYTELGWIASCDAVFVGSEYHKRAIIERRIQPYACQQDVQTLSDKIVVTGNPLFEDDYPDIPYSKVKRLIISNRFDYEKRPNLSLDFAVILKNRIPDLNIVVTTSRPQFTSNKAWLLEYARVLEAQGVIEIRSGLSKSEYYTYLATSKVMLTNSIEENFGYCIAEALIYNCAPLAENKFSHPELLSNNTQLLFNDMDEIIDKVQFFLALDSFDGRSYVSKYFNSMQKICKHMINS